MNGNYCAKSKSVEVLVDQIGQNTKKKKKNYFRTKWVAHIIYNELVGIDEKSQR